ncbi:carotenoid biosynthesis protein [Pseudalkalibacillus caeni]|uniref:Carotenoid biosynthesis protein n=1 Tax=Exobacillus caeni TaxID=2574798 RepID=A0A5R9EZ76_9BACL|nr:carotenoid biosynthesis protein [Pseudalkalibacillus caeni]
MLYYLFLFWYGCGIILLTFNLLPPALEWANAVFLMLAGTLGALYLIVTYGKLTGGLVTLGIIIISILAEGLGVHYGLLFGSYDYNADFGLKLFGVPLAIGFAWVMVISTTHVIAGCITDGFQRKGKLIHGLVYSVTGAILAVVMDLILDPVAFVVKEYWIWEGESIYYNIPLQNFFGWFMLAFIFHLAIHFLLARFSRSPADFSSVRSQRMVLLYVLVTVMFTILGLTAGLWLASLLIVCFVTPAIILYRQSSKRRKRYVDHL